MSKPSEDIVHSLNFVQDSVSELKDHLRDGLAEMEEYLETMKRWTTCTMQAQSNQPKIHWRNLFDDILGLQTFIESHYSQVAVMFDYIQSHVSEITEPLSSQKEKSV